MGDICETNDILLGPSGGDYELLTLQERNSGDLSRLTYTYNDKMMLCQYEAAAASAKIFSKFTQDRRETFPYVIYEVKHVISVSRENSFDMVQGTYTYII